LCLDTPVNVGCRAVIRGGWGAIIVVLLGGACTGVQARAPITGSGGQIGSGGGSALGGSGGASGRGGGSGGLGGSSDGSACSGSGGCGTTLCGIGQLKPPPRPATTETRTAATDARPIATPRPTGSAP